MKLESIKESPHKDFAKRIYIDSFPNIERRDFSEIENTIYLNLRIFDFKVVSENNLLIGILGIWNFENFLYIEHLAIEKSLRGRSYGKILINIIKNHFPKPIIIEVEPPREELSIRRIRFYNQLGFILLNEPYSQPPYRGKNPFIELRLMVYSNNKIQDLDIKTIINKIHKKVYNYY